MRKTLKFFCCVEQHVILILRVDLEARGSGTVSPQHAISPRPSIPMPSSDYVSAGGGLKFKGAGINKKKKKKSKTAKDSSTGVTKSTSADPEASKSPSKTPARSISPEAAERSVKDSGGRQKTEAEKRHDEMRRKRLDERLKREGVKTHKERVEELNRYLSGLSEHHDMPKIGPG